MIRKIILPVRGDGKADNVFAHAAALANRFKAQVVVTHCRTRPGDLLPLGFPVPTFMKKQMIDHAIEIANLEEKTLRATITKLAKKFKLKLTDSPTGKSASFSWVEEAGRQVDVIKRHGRLADLIAVPKPDSGGALGVNRLKGALFHTGRPVLMCPNTGKVAKDFGSHIAIAWNGSTEAARAVALTLSLIESAKTISILTGGEEINGASAENLAAYLKIRGLKSTIERFKPSRNIGSDLLKQCTVIGADLMIMGAYGDSYEKEIVFGGNTQTIIDSATMPIVLVH